MRADLETQRGDDDKLYKRGCVVVNTANCRIGKQSGRSVWILPLLYIINLIFYRTDFFSNICRARGLGRLRLLAFFVLVIISFSEKKEPDNERNVRNMNVQCFMKNHLDRMTL